LEQVNVAVFVSTQFDWIKVWTRETSVIAA
jgi:hypothetical protein